MENDDLLFWKTICTVFLILFVILAVHFGEPASLFLCGIFTMAILYIFIYEYNNYSKKKK